MSYNFGPNDDNNFSVKHLINEIQLNCKNFKWKGVSKKNQNYEAGLLKLNCDKALSHLSWFPVLNFKETIKMTIDWYKNHNKNIISSYDQLFLYTKMLSESID